MEYDEVVFSRLSKVCKGAYQEFQKGKAPPLPWFVYTHRNGEEFHADNENYLSLPRYRVELYFKEVDKDLIRRFEAALSDLGTWRRYSDGYIESERCHMHDYNLAASPTKLEEIGEQP